MRDPARFYGWLLNLYPARFRTEYRGEMLRQFRDDYREADGWRARAGLWAGAVRDLAASIPRELWCEVAGDLRFSLRLYRRRAVSALFAVGALGLAIGTSTAVFSVMNALLWRTLPFEDPEQLIEVVRSPVSGMTGRPAFLEWRDANVYLQDAAIFSVAEMSLAGKHEASRVKVAETSANFMRLLGAQPAAGRFFTPAEDLPGQTGVAVISHALWQQWFGGDPDLTDVMIHLNGAPFTVIGVAPPRFDYPGRASVWTPAVFDVMRVPKRGATFYFTVGRLKDGLTVGQAQRSIEATDTRPPQDRAVAVSLQEQLAGSVGQASWLLGGLVLLVLLTACANVAHLLLSRTVERRPELALRAALGASRPRLLQQLATEALVLTLAAALLGLLVARWTLLTVTAVLPGQLASQDYSLLDWRVVGFALLLALGTGVMFGVLPATRSQPWSRGGLVALQAGLTLPLLACSVSIGQTMLRLLNTDLGFATPNVATVSLSTHGTKYRSVAAQRGYYGDVLAAIRRLPGVESVGAVTYLPLSSRSYTMNLVRLDTGESAGVNMNAAMPGYFRTVGTSVVAGREFEDGDGARSSRPVVVDETFVKQARLGARVLGREVKVSWSKAPYTIVGIVEPARIMGPSYGMIPQIFFPMEEEPPAALTFVAKTRGDAGRVVPALASTIRAIDQTVPVYDAMTLGDRLNQFLARPRFYTTAILFLAGLALVVAAAGIYGAAAYSVAQRKPEMGLRMALGASALRVRAMVVRQTVQPILAGMAVGTAGAYGAGRYVASLVTGAEPMDPWTCGVGALTLGAAALAAAWIATNRVMGIAPAEALRTQ